MTARCATAVVLLLAVVACALAVAPAQAGVLALDDAAELAQSLADAQAEQGICYGWHITNNFDGVPDNGSSVDGPMVPLLFARHCTRGNIVLEGSIDYSCNSCDASDSASISIASSFAQGPKVKDLEKLGLEAGDLTGDHDDTTLINMVNALPLLAADLGLAPYLAYEPAKKVPPTDHATGTPGSDLLRDRGTLFAICALLILAGPGLYLYKRYQKSC